MLSRIKYASLMAVVLAVPPALLPGQTAPRGPAASGVQPAARYSISGVVVNAASGRPVSRASVTLNTASDGKEYAETATGEDGRFAFERLPAGKYELVAARRGYFTSSYEEHGDYSSAIVTGEGLVSDGLTLRLPPQAVIYGTVTDSSGDPVPQATVSIFHQDMRSGLGNIVMLRMVGADDLGAYEIAGLQPGDYYLAVSGRPWYATRLRSMGPSNGQAPNSPLNVAYPMTFYPDVTDANSAAPIPVKAGDRVPVNFSLHAVPALHFTIHPSDGVQGALGSPLPQLQQDAFGVKVPLQTAVSVNHGNGDGIRPTIEIDGIAPGDYQVEARTGGSVRIASVHATEDMSLDSLQATPLAEVTGKFAMADGGKIPEGLRAALRSADGQFASRGAVDKDGIFTMQGRVSGSQGVAPGHYQLTASAGARTFAIAQMTADGATAKGQSLEVGSEPVMVAALLTQESAKVTGYVKRDGKAIAGAMVVLAPKSPEAEALTFRRDQSDSDGSFTLNRVIPGEYTVVAIQDGWTLDWARPAVIEHYLRLGEKVTVPAHAGKVPLPNPVQVQPR